VDDGLAVERQPDVELEAVGALGLRPVETLEGVLERPTRRSAVPIDPRRSEMSWVHGSGIILAAAFRAPICQELQRARLHSRGYGLEETGLTRRFDPDVPGKDSPLAGS
jgi:hypothetical protein